MLQALASVRDHKSKSTMRPRRLAASCAQKQRCVARACGTLHGKQQGRTAGLLRAGGLGSGSYSHSTGSFFGFPLTLLSPRLACTSLLWASAASLSTPWYPVLDLSMTQSSPPLSVLQLGGQTGWWQASATNGTIAAVEMSVGPPSGCLMHDSVATALCTARQDNGAHRQLVDGRAGSRKSGVPVALHRSVDGPRLGRPVYWLLRSSRDQRMGNRQAGKPTRRPLTTSHCARCPTNEQAGSTTPCSLTLALLSLQVLQAIDQVTDRSI